MKLNPCNLSTSLTHGQKLTSALDRPQLIFDKTSLSICTVNVEIFKSDLFSSNPTHLYKHTGYFSWLLVSINIFEGDTIFFSNCL